MILGEIMKKIKITNILLAFLLCFPLHFLYDKFPNLITSIISPVNESIWEHMKLLFTSIIVIGIIEKIYYIIKKKENNNLLFINFISALISIPIFLIIFFPIYYIIGENFVITIIIMLISIAISVIIPSYFLHISNLSLDKITIIFILIIYIIFGYLTYNPPQIDLFYDTNSSTYGISK